MERVGVSGRDITFRGSGTTIEACDRSPHARAVRGLWCGGAGWTLQSGKVSDPRLDICTDRHGRGVVAFAWINAVPHAKWIVVDQPGLREVYPVAANLPVRVATVSGIGSPTTFHTAQYDARGVLLARRTVKAVVAG